MPSIIPSYLYSIFAALLVGAIIVCCCSLSTLNMKNQALNQQLTNIDGYMATQSLILISQTTEKSQNTTKIIEIPSQIGNQQFWIRIANDSSNAWVESGFGAPVNSTGPRVSIPVQVIASGTYTSGSGRAALCCYYEDSDLKLVLTQE